MNTSFKTGNKAYEKVLNLGSNQKSEYWNHDMNQNVKNFLSWAISTLVRCESVIALIYCWLECKLGEGNGTPLQYPCLENPMGRGAWWAAVHGVTKSQTWLSDFTFTFHFHALEKEMATHSSVLAWRVPGTGEPGGLLMLEWGSTGMMSWWRTDLKWRLSPKCGDHLLWDRTS